jgi:hypothetical protein|uniref:Apple domain-containing protein n=1 Tax=viral metagenome TaxID=1070528 RepID=A0A6C0BFA5_9ZZZZ
MSGTANVLSGFIELTVSPVQQQLNPITVKNYPLSISFAPRSTPPSLQGNKIIESTDNSTNDCTYRGNKYKLVDIQICSVMNKRFLLPGQGNLPSAELMISFSPKSSSTSIKQVDGIVLCVPIYDSGTPNHNEYLTQLIDPNMPKCKYTQKEGVSYTAGEYKSIPNSNLMNCVKSCCGDPNCISYTFNSGKCSLNNTVSDLQSTSDTSITSGTINRSGDGENTVEYKSLSPTLETIFYNSAVDTSQTSLAYKTTFNTVNASNVITSTRTLYIVVFPNGIRMTSSTYQQLLLQMRSMNPSITQTLLPYYVPLVIRNYENTLVSYGFDSYGNKIPKRTSNKGEISQNTLSSCNDEFRNRVQYFTMPPHIISKSKSFNTEKCPYYKTNEYKCVPFNQLHDLSGVDQDAYVIPGNSTLQSILDKNKSPTSGSSVSVSMATDDIIVYSTIAICGIVGLFVLYKLGTKIKEEL